MTEPPPRNTFCSNVSQWEIFDAYQQDYQLNVIIKISKTCGFNNKLAYPEKT
jgi:hypothetical protein